MSRMWVKICANTSLEDAQHAIRAGADAVGFVFAAESKRRVTAEQVAAITLRLPEITEKIGVFVEQKGAEIADIVRAAGLTGVQLHAPNAEAAAESSAWLRANFDEQKRRLRIVQVLHFDAAQLNSFEKQIVVLGSNDAVDAVLIDSRAADALGGTGVAYDWSAAQRLFLRASQQMRLIVAGGLTAQNVRQAILTLAPWGVDVASGVELAAGKKDPLKVEKFISIAREAGAEMNNTPVSTEA